MELLTAATLILVASTLRGQIPAAAPAPASVAGTAVAAAAPQPKPLVILRPDGTKAIALRARTVSVGANLFVGTLDGAAQTLDVSTYLNQLPWYTDAELQSGRVDLNALAIRYRAFGGLYPDVRATLYAEAQKFRNIAERLKTASEQSTAATQTRATNFLAARFDPEKITARDEVAGFVHEGDELVRLLPAQAPQFAQAAAPFRDALTKLDAGQSFYEGRWLPGTEVQALREQRADAAIQQTFDQTLVLPLEPLALTSGQLLQAIALPAVVLAALLIAGLALLAGKRRGLGVLLLVVAVVGGGLGYTLLTQNNAGTLTIPALDAPETQKSSARLVRLLYRASLKGSTPLPLEDRNVHLTNADLNSFLVRHVQPKEGADAAGGLRRESVVLGVTSDGFTLIERTAAAGQTIFLRYELKLDATGAAPPSIKEFTVKAGGVTLPGPIKDWLCARLLPAFGEYLANRHILEVYAVTDMSRGTVDLAATQPLTTTTTAPTSAPVPVPDKADSAP